MKERPVKNPFVLMCKLKRPRKSKRKSKRQSRKSEADEAYENQVTFPELPDAKPENETTFGKK